MNTKNINTVIYYSIRYSHSKRISLKIFLIEHRLDYADKERERMWRYSPLPPLKASVMTFIKPEQYREVGSECQVECAKSFSNHVALIEPTKTCSKTIILVKSTTAFKLEHLKEQAQKLATRIFFFARLYYTKQQMLARGT